MGRPPRLSSGLCLPQAEPACRRAPPYEKGASPGARTQGPYSPVHGTAALAVQDDDAAREALEELIRRDPAGPHAPDALDELAGIEIRRGRPPGRRKALRASPPFSGPRKGPRISDPAGEHARPGRQKARGSLRVAEAVAPLPGKQESGPRPGKIPRAGRGPQAPLRTLGPRDYFIRARKLHITYHYEKALKGYREVNRLFLPVRPSGGKLPCMNRSRFFPSAGRPRPSPPLGGDSSSLPGLGRAGRGPVYPFEKPSQEARPPGLRVRGARAPGRIPGGKWAAKTRYLLARVSEDDLEYESASRFYQEIIEKHSFSPSPSRPAGSSHGSGLDRRTIRAPSRALERWRACIQRADSFPPPFTGERWPRSGPVRGEKAEFLFRKCAQVYRHRYYGHLAKSALRRMARKSGFGPKPLPLPIAGYLNWSRPPGAFSQNAGA